MWWTSRPQLIRMKTRIRKRDEIVNALKSVQPKVHNYSASANGQSRRGKNSASASFKSYSFFRFDFFFWSYPCKGLRPNLVRISFHSSMDFSPPPRPPLPPLSAAVAVAATDDPPTIL